MRIEARRLRGKEARTAEVEYPSCVRTCSLALCIISAPTDNATSCQVIGCSSNSGSPVVEELGSSGLSVMSSLGQMGMTFVLASQIPVVGGGGKGASVPP
jgi:hypothetical protein